MRSSVHLPLLAITALAALSCYMTDNVFRDLYGAEPTETAAALATMTPTSAGEFRFTLLEFSDPYCFRKISPNETTQLCDYTLAWEIEYPERASSATIQCMFLHADGSSVQRARNIEDTGRGLWSDATDLRGSYPGLGTYTERIACWLLEWDPQTNKIGRELAFIKATFEVPFATLREDGGFHPPNNSLKLTRRAGPQGLLVLPADKS
jgi:hypothetical protein